MEKTEKNKALNRRRWAVLDFARDHGLVIHPGKGFEYYIDGFTKCGHCPCDDTRKACPCPESVEECKNDGCCTCRLYWRDLDTYKKSHVPEG